MATRNITRMKCDRCLSEQDHPGADAVISDILLSCPGKLPHKSWELCDACIASFWAWLDDETKS